MGAARGAPVRVVVRPSEGPVRLAAGGAEVPVAGLSVVSSARATTVEGAGGALRVGTVEHAFAALAGMGLRAGLTLDVEGPEMPLLDGGASRWCEAFAALRPAPSPPSLRVTREASFDVGPSRFDFAPGDAVDVRVQVELGDARFAPEATWSGDARDFIERIAPARTFALAHEVEELARRGLARHVDPESVVVLAPEAVHFAGRPYPRRAGTPQAARPPGRPLPPLRWSAARSAPSEAPRARRQRARLLPCPWPRGVLEPVR